MIHPDSEGEAPTPASGRRGRDQEGRLVRRQGLVPHQGLFFGPVERPVENSERGCLSGVVGSHEKRDAVRNPKGRMVESRKPRTREIRRCLIVYPGIHAISLEWNSSVNQGVWAPRGLGVAPMVTSSAPRSLDRSRQDDQRSRAAKRAAQDGGASYAKMTVSSSLMPRVRVLPVSVSPRRSTATLGGVSAAMPLSAARYSGSSQTPWL
jgi:hypothetical protein